MPGPLSARPHRAAGSWIPRLAGVGVVGVVAVGGLIGYLVTAKHPAAHHHRHKHAVLSSKVLKAQTVGIIGFGPDDDKDSFAHDADDHPLMLEPGSGALRFVAIPRGELTAGVPVWTADLMADGNDIFIDTATGQCMTAARHMIRLAHCDLSLAQRWRPVDAATSLGQAFAKYASASTGQCITAPRGHPGLAALQPCGPPRLKTQEIAFWWNA